VPRWTARDVCRERYLQEQVDARRSWGTCLPLLDLTRYQGNIRGCALAVRPEHGKLESDLTGMTVMSAVWRFVIVLLMKKFVILMTQFLRNSAKVLTKIYPHIYFGCISPIAWRPRAPHRMQRLGHEASKWFGRRTGAPVIGGFELHRSPGVRNLRTKRVLHRRQPRRMK